MADVFRVGLTPDFLTPEGEMGWGDIGLGRLDAAPGIRWEFLPGDGRELGAALGESHDALLVLGPRVTAATVSRAERLALVARFGVGYDNVAVGACTDAGVLLTNTPDGVRRPAATAAIALLLALTHRLRAKDRLTRERRWTEKLSYMGVGLTGKTLGIVGLGNVGQEVARLAQPFGMRLLATSPHLTLERAAACGVEAAPLPTLLETADFVCLTCALTPETHHLIGGRELAMMKPTSFLVNMARGAVVDQPGLTEALQDGRIAGAALDVFDPEPIDPADPLLALDNVLLTPHAACWTDEIALGNGASAIQAVLDVAAGRTPTYVVNPEVLDHPALREKLRRLESVGSGS